MKKSAVVCGKKYTQYQYGTRFVWASYLISEKNIGLQNEILLYFAGNSSQVGTVIFLRVFRKNLAWKGLWPYIAHTLITCPSLSSVESLDLQSQTKCSNDYRMVYTNRLKPTLLFSREYSKLQYWLKLNWFSSEVRYEMNWYLVEKTLLSCHHGETVFVDLNFI